MGCSILEVEDSNGGSDGGVASGACASENSSHILHVPESHVPVVWHVFDHFDALDLALHILVGLLHVLAITSFVMTSAHCFYNLIITLDYISIR